MGGQMRRFGVLSVACLAGLVAVLVVGVVGGQSASKAITPSPQYTAAQLGAPAGDDWLMHMGNIKGWRYSSLNQINKTNVSTLKQAWKINLGYCATKDAACGSLEANAVVANGVYYFQAPLGQVYALDGATGAKLWTWTPTYDAGFNIGTGGRKPGVAIGGGLVFAGMGDGKLVALDQTSGTVVWSTEVTPWRKGGKIASAPIYVNGMVLTGDAAGDNGGNSATMQAFAASNGRRLWSWSMIPQAGAPGSKTWSANS